MGVRDGHLHLHWYCTYWPGRRAPRSLHPAPSSLRVSQLTRLRCAGNSGQREKWKCRWNRTSCPAGAGRALRNISAATSRGRPPGNDAGSGPPPKKNAPRWARWTRWTGAGRAVSQGSQLGRAPSGVSTYPGRGGRKRRADRVDTSTLAPRFMVRCADYIRVLAINVFQIGAVIHRCWGQGELVVPPRRFLCNRPETPEGHTSGGLGTQASARCHVPRLVTHASLLSAVSVCLCSRQQTAVVSVRILVPGWTRHLDLAASA